MTASRVLVGQTWPPCNRAVAFWYGGNGTFPSALYVTEIFLNLKTGSLLLYDVTVVPRATLLLSWLTASSRGRVNQWWSKGTCWYVGKMRSKVGYAFLWTVNIQDFLRPEKNYLWSSAEHFVKAWKYSATAKRWKWEVLLFNPLYVAACTNGKGNAVKVRERKTQSARNATSILMKHVSSAPRLSTKYLSKLFLELQRESCHSFSWSYNKTVFIWFVLQWTHEDSGI